MSRLLWFFQLLLIVLFTLPLAVIPYKASLKVGDVLGYLLFYLWKSRRVIALENLRSAVSRNAILSDLSPESITMQNFRNLGKSFIEVVKIYYGLDSQIYKNIKINGEENFRKALAKGRGVILITGHCGNWELSGIALSLKLTKMNAIARPLNNPYLNRIIEKAREKYGNNIIYKRGALKKILSSLKRNEPVTILMDQSVTRSEGIIIDFLGKNAYTTKMPALIARRTDSPVLPFFIRRVKGGHRIEIGEEIKLHKSEDSEKDILSNTINFTKSIEEYIRKNPSEWLWIHRRWKRIKD